MSKLYNFNIQNVDTGKTLFDDDVANFATFKAFKYLY
jgi:hypothetical protein